MSPSGGARRASHVLRAIVLGAVAVLALLAVVRAPAREAPCVAPSEQVHGASVPRDVFLIVVDTLRADHLPLYGYARDTAPHLNALARDSVTYLQATSPGTWTVPAHASMFTGLWPSMHGAERSPGERMTARPLRAEVRTLAEILGEAGFHPAAFVGNWTFVTPSLGFGRGFREFFDGPVSHPPDLVASFRKWLAAQDGRIFVFVNFLDPHEPFEPPPPLDARYPTRHAELGTWITRAIYADKRPVTPELVEHFTSQYDGEIVFVDRALGALLERLKKSCRYDDALIVVTSDHGELFGEHGLGGHALFPYEPLVHVPLVVKYPHGWRAGEQVERRVSTRSIFASILGAVGEPLPDGVDTPALDEPHEVWVEHVAENGDRHRAGYDGHLKLTQVIAPDGVRTEAFDLASDPDEVKPLSDAGGAAARPLRAALDAFAALPRPLNAQAAPVVDPIREQQLRHLGYLH